MSRRLVLTFAWLAAAAPAAGGEVVKIRDVGPDENRLVLALVAEGYLASQRDAFMADAQEALAGFLSETPYLEYAAWTNAYADFVPSNETGADKPAACYGTALSRDTAFDATYCTNGIRRLLTVDAAAVFSLLNADVPTWDVAAVIVNDAEYGGAGGAVLTFSTDPGAMVELFLHEAGHTFARLADEYVSYREPYPGGEPREPNATTELDRATTKWSPWIDAATPLPTPPAPGWTVGLFEGARYYETGVFRPVDDCKMRSLNRGFCAVCREAHVQELHARVSPLDAALPEPGEVLVAPCGEAEFSLELLPIDPPTLEVEWRLDGAPLPGENGPTLRLDPSLVPPAGGSLEAFVFDATALVRRPYLRPMTASAEWTLLREPGSDLDGDGLDDACDPDADGDGLPNEEDCGPLDAGLGPPARAVARLDVERAGAAARLAWEDVVALDSRPGGVHAVLSGRLGELRADRGFARACRLPHDASAERLDARLLPGAGWAAFWYLVAVEDDCGSGELLPAWDGSPGARGALSPPLLPPCP